MYTSIKVKDSTKHKLDNLQSEFTLRTGRKISLTKLMDKISDFIIQHEGEFIKKTPSLKDDPAWNEPLDWGVTTDASKVDEYLYE